MKQSQFAHFYLSKPQRNLPLLFKLLSVVCLENRVHNVLNN